MLKRLAVIGALLSLPAFATAEVVEEQVTYDLPDGTQANGWLVHDDDMDGDRPGVLVIPEWWGLTDYPKMRARELAEMGYVAFVADMYGEGQTTEDPQQAGEWSGKAQQTGLAELAEPALKQLKQADGVDTGNLAAIGFCFGGSTVVDMAQSDYAGDLKAVVSFHGGLNADAAPAEGETYEGPAMLILHGGDDPFVPNDSFAQFVGRCISAQAPITVVSFPGAKHAFSNPDATETAEKTGMDGIGYDEAAAEQSIEIMEEFFEMTIGDGDEEDGD